MGDTRDSNLKIIFGVLLFLLVATGGAFVYFNYINPRREPVPIPERPRKLINASERVIYVSGAHELLSGINEALTSPKSENKFEVFLFAQKKDNLEYYITLAEFISETGLGIPEKLRNSIVSYNFGRTDDPFLIFEITSSDDARAGALSWERSMPEGLDALFPKLENRVARDFRDEVIKNQDVRVFESGDGKIFYTFFNKKFLIIASSKKSLEDILNQYSLFPPN